jgi:hypothetical protein
MVAGLPLPEVDVVKGKLMSRPSCVTSAVVAGLLLAAGPRLPPAAHGQAAVWNVQVSCDAFAAHAEPSIAANPRAPRNLLGAAQLIASTRASAVLRAAGDLRRAGRRDRAARRAVRPRRG